jgi:hypothetical protein
MSPYGVVLKGLFTAGYVCVFGVMYVDMGGTYICGFGGAKTGLQSYRNMYIRIHI